MQRGEIYLARLPAPIGNRPVLVVLRNGAVKRLANVVVAPISSVIRGIRSEVGLGPEHGLRAPSVAQCDSLQSIDKARLSSKPVGRLDAAKIRELDRALRVALAIKCRSR